MKRQTRNGGRTVRMNVRISPEEREMIQQYADEFGMTMANYVVWRALQKPRSATKKTPKEGEPNEQ